MSRKSSLVAIAQKEGLGSVRGPHAVELGRVPKRLVCELWHSDGMGGRARIGVEEGTSAGVVHMRHMVGAIEVHTVPASVYC